MKYKRDIDWLKTRPKGGRIFVFSSVIFGPGYEIVLSQNSIEEYNLWISKQGHAGGFDCEMHEDDFLWNDISTAAPTAYLNYPYSCISYSRLCRCKYSDVVAVYESVDSRPYVFVNRRTL